MRVEIQWVNDGEGFGREEQADERRVLENRSSDSPGFHIRRLEADRPDVP
ncbi:MAG TPA: hypothetical protein VJA26_17485 [Gammaproteobacteria bacterium]|nr:hypothetical protein [Gammaproteobacteria bacterium]